MPRLLLVAHDYPPRFAPGAIRVAGLAKYLERLGWDISVLTPTLPAGPRPPARVVETGNENVLAKWKSRFGIDPERPVHDQLGLQQSSELNTKRLSSLAMRYMREVIAFPDEHKGWIRFAVKAASELEPEQRPEVVLSSSPPVSAHIIGCALKRMYGCRWVADFRDLWADNLAGKSALLKPFHRRLEAKTLRSADALVTVSEPWARRLRTSYQNHPVYTITNGFDAEEFSSRESAPLSRQFTITHTGYLYEGKRDPTPLFHTLKELIGEGALQASDVQVRFYGPTEPWLHELVKRCGVAEIVTLGGVIPREEALRRQAESQILLVLGWSDPRETGQHTGKLFEYFGSARPILAVGGFPGVLTETLRETNAGVHVLSKQQLRDYLLSAYMQFKRTGSVPYHPDEHAVSAYTHKEMAEKFSRILESSLEPAARRAGNKASENDCVAASELSFPHPLATHSSPEVK